MKAFTADGRGRIRLLVLAVLAAALTLTGAAKIGHAAGSNGQLTATTSVLNDQSPLVAGAPTPGKNIGYDLGLFNDPSISTSTVNHIAFTDSIGNKGTVVYINAPPSVSCTGLGTSTLSCTSVQLASGAGFHVIVLFSTDPKATAGVDVISNSGSGTYAPQSNNTSNNRTDTTKTFTFGGPAVDRTYAGGAGLSVDQSLALPGDALNAPGGFFSSTVQMPPGFLHSNNYVGVTLQNSSNVLPPNPTVTCPKCQPFEVSTTIPLASTVDSVTNPFLQGGSTQVYTWSFTIPVANGFKPGPVFHTDDNNANGVFLPACQILNGQPQPLTTAPGICTLPPTVSKGSQWTATYSGIGVANGNTWGTG